MKTELRQQARNLYFDTNLTKTEIAEKLGVNRRTIMLWCRQGNWDRLKMSAHHLPSIIAEKCYYLVDHLATELLTRGTNRPITHKDADTIYKLASGIKKLKNRNTVNECMEMFNFFLEDLKKKDEALAIAVRPHMESYLKARNDVETTDFLLEGFDEEGYLPIPIKEMDERFWDQSDSQALRNEINSAGGDYDEAIRHWLNEETT